MLKKILKHKSMHKITFFRLNKRFLKLISIIILIFSSVVYGLTPKTTFDHNINRVYLFTDVASECIDESAIYGPQTAEEAGYIAPEALEVTESAAGSVIINMGAVPQTIENGLKPYGIVHDLLNESND